MAAKGEEAFIAFAQAAAGGASPKKPSPTPSLNLMSQINSSPAFVPLRRVQSENPSRAFFHSFINRSNSLNGNHMLPMSDFKSDLSEDERKAVRAKLREAYTRNCSSFEDLLDTVVGVDEGLILSGAQSRLDYFKRGFDFGNRVAGEKRRAVAAAEAETEAGSKIEAETETETGALAENGHGEEEDNKLSSTRSAGEGGDAGGCAGSEKAKRQKVET